MARAGLSANGLTMPSTADELAALNRSNSARRSAGSSQGLLCSNDAFMPPLSPSAAPGGEDH